MPVMSAQNHKPQVLVIDDDPLFREMIRNMLQNDFRIQTAPTTEDGMRLFTDAAPDAVLLDLVMPGKDGIWALRAMRREDPTVAIAILTGHAALETAKEAISLGARFYIEKPVDAEELKRTLIRCVESTRQQRHQEQAVAEMKGLISDLHAELEKKERVLRQARCAVELMYDLSQPLESAVSQICSLEEYLSGNGNLGGPEHYQRLVKSFRLLERCMERCRLLTELSRALEQEDHPQSVSVADLLRRISDDARPWVRNAGISLDVRILVRNPSIRADPRLLEMAIRNILIRALHAAADNGGAVRLACVQETAAVELRVEDHGRGCDLEALSRRLRPHFSRRDVQTGAGMGLLLSGRVVQRYGGSFHVQSAPGKGTVVFIAFPL
ncbi:MAG TPA: hybrid sensor histidine kinase/response regulator [Kiritimatiellae bacterium]|nr:hybrid sensor histidine kinase/response regulator [Kiritimatiellia bacterium]